MSVSGEWRVELGAGGLLRQGARRDLLSLSWLIKTSCWTQRSRGKESLADLLRREPSVLWLHDKTIHGALLPSLYRHPVAAVRLLTMRGAEDRELFFDLVLPHAEARLGHLGARWLGFSGCEDWLVEEIVARGYRVVDRVASYEKVGLHAQGEGNCQVLVRKAIAEDLTQINALDAAAFVPFWRLNEAIMRQFAQESPYFIIAELDRTVAGYLVAERWGRRACISRLGVLPILQGQGIGTRLMLEAFALMRSDGLRGAFLNTQQNNTRSHKLYEKLGFRLTGEGRTHWAKPLLALSPARFNNIETQ